MAGETRTMGRTATACKVGPLAVAKKLGAGRTLAIAGSRLTGRRLPNDPMLSPKQSFIIGLAALAALITAVYWPVRTFDFVRWDDDINFTQNPLITAPWSWELAGQLAGAGQALRFKPVYWLACRALHGTAGFNPAAWHIAGLLLHVTAALLFSLVLRQILDRGRPPGPRVMVTALLTAGIWALHPLRAETVGWVTASPYALTAVFLLGSFACYLQAPGAGRQAGRWLAAAWLLAVLGYGTYPAGATFGLWLMAVDCWLGPRAGTDAPAWAVPGRVQWWLKQVLFLVPAVAAVGITVWTRYQTPGIFTAAPDIAAIGLPTRVVVALANLGVLAWRLVWPVNLTPNLPPLNLGLGTTLLAVLVAAGAAAFALLWAWRQRHRESGVALVLLGCAALALPCLGLTERPNWPVDRYSHLAHLVLIGGAAALTLRLQGRWLGAAGLAAVLAVVGSGQASRRQLMIWQDSESLFTHMEQHPGFGDNPRQKGHVYILWARTEATAGRLSKAAELFNRAQETYVTAIRLALQRQDYPEALALCSHLEHHFGLTSTMRREKGAWLLQLGRRAEAMVELRQAESGLPDDRRLQTLQVEAATRAPAPTGPRHER